MSFWGWVGVLLGGWFALSVLMVWAWSRMPRSDAGRRRCVTRWERERDMAAASRRSQPTVSRIPYGGGRAMSGPRLAEAHLLALKVASRLVLAAHGKGAAAAAACPPRRWPMRRGRRRR